MEITRYQWTVLLMTWLGFLFDLMDSTLYMESRSFGLAPDAPVASTTRMLPPAML